MIKKFISMNTNNKGRKLFTNGFDTLSDGTRVFYPVSRELVAKPYVVPDMATEERLWHKAAILGIFGFVGVIFFWQLIWRSFIVDLGIFGEIPESLRLIALSILLVVGYHLIYHKELFKLKKWRFRNELSSCLGRVQATGKIFMLAGIQKRSGMRNGLLFLISNI